MRINQNISALNAYRNMVNTENRLNKSLERLSSGLRINRAADDAAGLAISEKMRGQIQGLNQAMRNAQDGISLIQTAEGALNETHSILQRMRELSIQAANDTLTASDRMEIQKEIDQLTAEIDRIANTTEFNTKKLLDGTTSALTSTDDLKTKVFMRDGLRTIDQFGQKAVEGGNFKLEIEATPGRGQIQKTDIMKVKHENNVETDETGQLRMVMSHELLVTTANSNINQSGGITIQFSNTGANTATTVSVASGSITVNLQNSSASGTIEATMEDVYLALTTTAGGSDLQSGSLTFFTEAAGTAGSTLTFDQVFNFELLDGSQTAQAGSVTFGSDGEYQDDVGWFIGDIASRESQIEDLDRFWDASGNFYLDDPQTLTLVQGDGSKTDITFFATDTIADIEEKLNQAIHQGLGQNAVNSDAEAYVTYVDLPNLDEDSQSFNVEGTFIIQSAITGGDGEITFIGDENFINALSLTTIQESSETQYEVKVTNAHTGDEVTTENISGNMLIGAVHQNVDVKFDAMAGMELDVLDGDTNWDGKENDGAFGWNKTADNYETFVHLADNSMVFHIGANPLQDIDAAVGDMRAEALGVDNILVTNRDAANRAITQVDRAIEQVSSERSKLGAIQNRLDHTINNLGVAAENLTAAESRIRDLDFAQEMIEFTRNQIMQQAGTSMLAQANMKPQSVLMLLG